MRSTAFDPGLSATCHSKMASLCANELFHTSRHFTPSGRHELNKLTSLPMRQWPHSSVRRASHRYRGGHGFESRWSPDFFRLLSNCLNWKIYCDDHSSLSPIQPQFKYELFHIYFTSLWEQYLILIASFSSCCVTFSFSIFLFQLLTWVYLFRE